jgi:hypothetical protein
MNKVYVNYFDIALILFSISGLLLFIIDQIIILNYKSLYLTPIIFVMFIYLIKNMEYD